MYEEDVGFEPTTKWLTAICSSPELILHKTKKAPTLEVGTFGRKVYPLLHNSPNTTIPAFIAIDKSGVCSRYVDHCLH